MGCCNKTKLVKNAVGAVARITIAAATGEQIRAPRDVVLAVVRASVLVVAVWSGDLFGVPGVYSVGEQSQHPSVP